VARLKKRGGRVFLKKAEQKEGGDTLNSVKAGKGGSVKQF